MSGVTVRLVGADRLSAYFDLMTHNFSPAQRQTMATDLQVMALSAHARYFDTNTDPSGKPWRPLSPVTIERRRKKRKSTKRSVGFTAQILRDTGMLRLSVSPGGVNGAVRRVSPFGFAIGSALVYASTHQFGQGRRTAIVRAHTRRTKRGVFAVRQHKTTLPAVPERPFVGFSSAYLNSASAYMLDVVIPPGGAR